MSLQYHGLIRKRSSIDRSYIPGTTVVGLNVLFNYRTTNDYLSISYCRYCFKHWTSMNKVWTKFKFNSCMKSPTFGVFAYTSRPTFFFCQAFSFKIVAVNILNVWIVSFSFIWFNLITFEFMNKLRKFI